MINKKENLVSNVRECVQNGKGKGTFTTIVPIEDLRGHGRLFSRISLEVGSSIGMHDHTEDFEVYYILSGNGVVNDNGKNIEVSEGDVIYTADGRVHSIENTGDKELEFIAVVLYDKK